MLHLPLTYLLPSYRVVSSSWLQKGVLLIVVLARRLALASSRYLAQNALDPASRVASWWHK